jgi:outer membrane protein assembly factor BamA
LKQDLIKYLHAAGLLGLLLSLLCPLHAFSQQAVEGERLVRVDSIIIHGNKITKDKIILREIVFDVGDYIRLSALDTMIDHSKQNLLNASLFNFVEISTAYAGIDETKVKIIVEVTERWYIWPQPILKLSDRNFNVWWQTKDLSRLSYGFSIDWQNFRGRKEHLILRLQWGYNRVIQLQYLVPYLNKKKTLGLGFGFGISRQREAAFQTVYNKQEFYKDPETFSLQNGYAFGQFVIRRNIYITHQFELRYDERHFSDSLINQNYNYTVDSANEVRYLTFSYLFKNDHRDFKSYPLKGYYFDFGLVKHGLWNFSSNTLNTLQIVATVRKYWKLDPRLYFATGLNGQYSAGLHPYFILNGIGYDRDMVRSYEYYLVDALNFGILKNNLKFALIPQRVKDLNFIKSDRFGKLFYGLYMNVFFDAGYGVYDQDFGKETNDLQNTLLLGYGAGLDLVTYYDVVVRLEFSINFMNETGIFLHFRAPI